MRRRSPHPPAFGRRPLPAERGEAQILCRVRRAELTRTALPVLRSGKRPIIVNVGSILGHRGIPHSSEYCASKFAIEGLTQSLAQELPVGMAAVALNPGIIDTGMLRDCFGAHAADYPSPVEWARLAGPFIAGLKAKDSGKTLVVPGIPTTG